MVNGQKVKIKPTRKLTLASGWVFTIKAGKLGRYRWRLDDEKGKLQAIGRIGGFATIGEAERNVESVCGATDKKMFASLFVKRI